MLLKDKVAIIHGAGGGVGSAVARAFSRAGARLFLAGRNLASVESIAREIVAAGGAAEVAQVDALDERAIDAHMDSVTRQAGRFDIVFNAVGIPNTTLQGVPMLELDAEQFALPIATYTKSYFLIARLAARRMVARKSGVIMAVTSTPSRTGLPNMGGVAPAMSAVESLTRGLSAEFAPHGVRVVGVRPHGMPDSRTIKEVFGLHAKAIGITQAQFEEIIARKTHARRLPSLAEMAEVATFAASDQASGLTGTTLNMSLGSVDD